MDLRNMTRTLEQYAARYGTARGTVTEHEPYQPGFGTGRTWSRMIGGRLYSFNAVLMPDGERRYFASRFDGTDMRFGHQWRSVLGWTFKNTKEEK